MEIIIKHLNSIGLFCDLLGVIFVAYSFKNIRREKSPAPIISDGNDKDNKILMFWDKLGMILLIIGFLLQIISNYIKLWTSLPLYTPW